ncbi:MAG: hypothetical protein ACI3ZO_10590 [Candidatus Cryptobacteroides sp.]|nr:hypothetical protein [Bacteroidales bacterium]
MKKTILIIAAVIGFATAVSAQPKAIGGRLGYGVEASYQHYLGDPNFLEINAGIWGLSDIGFKATGIYNFVFAQPKWSPRGSWAWYAGPGVTLGTAAYNDKTGKFFFGIVGQIGLEYEFWFPLQLSADLRPTFGFCDSEFYKDGISYGFIPTISVRYAF